MSGFLDRLRGQGKLHKQGEFTLDVEQAGSKLARFQFRDPRDFLYHMVAGLFRLGAEGLDISFKTGILQIGVRGLSLAADTLETLSAALLDPNSAQRRLAAASQSLLGQPLVRFDWVGSARDQVYDYLAGNGKNWATVELQAIRLEGLPTQLVDQACGELEKRASYCRRSLTLHNRPLGRPGGSERMADWPADFECRPGSASQLELVVDEMVTPPKTVTTDFPWHGVCYGEFSLDASLSDVVEDERYQRIVQAIPATYSACLSKVLDNPPRELLGKLLCAPAPAWARPGLWTRLRQLPLFRDQLDRQWSLEKLDELEGPIYFSGDKAPKDLPEVILLEPSACMRACLENQLPGRCQLAG